MQVWPREDEMDSLKWLTCLMCLCFKGMWHSLHCLSSYNILLLTTSTIKQSVFCCVIIFFVETKNLIFRWICILFCASRLCFILSHFPLHFITVTQTEANSNPSWTIKVPSSVEGLQGSCVVIPCSFDYPSPSNRVTSFTGMWNDATNQLIYHPDESKMMQQYRSRTKLLVDITESMKNCSLKIDPLQQSDRGPFHFRIEMEQYEKYSYKVNTVSITIISK